MKFLKRFGLFVLLLLILLLGVLWFLPGPIIKFAVETGGSRALGAKVDLARAELQWFPTALTLNGLAVTNPSKPMFNAVVIDTIATEIDLWSAIGGRYYFDRIQVTGVAADQPRQSSGAIDTGKVASEPKSKLGLPGLDIPVPKEAIEKEKQLYQQKATEFKQELDRRKQRWQTILDELPDDQRRDELEARWEAVEDEKLLLKLKTAKELLEAVDDDYQRVKNSEREIRKEIDQMQAEYKELKSLADKSATEVVAKLGLSDSIIAQSTAALLDGVVEQQIKEALAYYKLMLAPILSSDEEEPEPAAEPLTEPQFLVRLVDLGGKFQWQKTTGELTGKMLDLSDAPQLHDQPAVINLGAIGDRLGKWSLAGKLDHRGAVSSDALTLNLTNFAVARFSLLNTEDMKLALKDSDLTLTSNMDVSAGTNLSGQFKARFADYTLDLTGPEQNSSWGKALTQALSTPKGLVLEGTLSGKVTAPKVKLRTNMDEVLKQALKSGLKQETDALKLQVRTELNAALTEQLTRVDGPVAEFEALVEKFKLKSEAYKALTDKLGVKL